MSRWEPICQHDVLTAPIQRCHLCNIPAVTMPENPPAPRDEREYEDGGCSCLYRYHNSGRMDVLRVCSYHETIQQERDSLKEQLAGAHAARCCCCEWGPYTDPRCAEMRERGKG
jgi:hypothetical protein